MLGLSGDAALDRYGHNSQYNPGNTDLEGTEPVVSAGALFSTGRGRAFLGFSCLEVAGMARFELRWLEAPSLELGAFDLATFDLALAALGCFAFCVAGCTPACRFGFSATVAALALVPVGTFAGGRGCASMANAGVASSQATISARAHLCSIRPRPCLICNGDCFPSHFGANYPDQFRHAVDTNIKRLATVLERVEGRHDIPRAPDFEGNDVETECTVRATR